MVATFCRPAATDRELPLRLTCPGYCKRSRLVTMRFKVTSSALLLLLVSVQAFAADCDVRCATMAVVGLGRGNSTSDYTTNRMSSMTNCHGMARQRASGHHSEATLISSQPCASRICKNDWHFLQSSIAHEIRVSSPAIADPRQGSALSGVTSSLQFKTDPGTNSALQFDPLFVSLRV